MEAAMGGQLLKAVEEASLDEVSFGVKTVCRWRCFFLWLEARNVGAARLELEVAKTATEKCYDSHWNLRMLFI